MRFTKPLKGNGRHVVPVEMEKQAAGWQGNMAALEAALAKPENKILLLCSPQNPTGKVWTRDELTQMAELCAL
jgi:cystathionine beta-lyase